MDFKKILLALLEWLGESIKFSFMSRFIMQILSSLNEEAFLRCKFDVKLCIIQFIIRFWTMPILIVRIVVQIQMHKECYYALDMKLYHPHTRFKFNIMLYFPTTSDTWIYLTIVSTYKGCKDVNNSYLYQINSINYTCNIKDC